MNRGFPSMTALLGLLAIAGYQNRDGQADTVDSWVSTGPNKQIAPSQVELAIGPDVLETLSKQTGLSRDEILARLSRELPEAVDKYTPHGRLPATA